MTIPNRLPVMLLPSCNLFPHGLLPLHIFEPHYCHMLKNVIEGDRMFCIGMIEAPSPTPVENSKSGVHSISTAGFLRACVEQEDGCSNLLLQGISRIRLSDFDQTLPYTTAAVEVLKTERSTETSEYQLGNEIRSRIQQLAEAGVEISAQVQSFIDTVEDLETLVDLVAYNFVSDPHTRQPWLEELNLRSRLHSLVSHLGRQLNQVGGDNDP